MPIEGLHDWIQSTIPRNGEILWEGGIFDPGDGAGDSVKPSSLGLVQPRVQLFASLCAAAMHQWVLTGAPHLIQKPIPLILHCSPVFVSFTTCPLEMFFRVCTATMPF